MDEATRQSIFSACRSILVAIGGVLTAKGFADDATVNMIIGAAMVILPAGYGIWQKLHAEKKTQEREAIAVNAGIALSNQSTTLTSPVGKQEAKDVIATFAGQPEGAKP